MQLLWLLGWLLLVVALSAWARWSERRDWDRFAAFVRAYRDSETSAGAVDSPDTAPAEHHERRSA